MFENFKKYARFTDHARKVMQLANQEAARFNHEYIATEHILLGLLKERGGVAANVLKHFEIDLRKLRLEVERIVPSGPDTVVMGQRPQTPRVKAVIDYAIEEAENLHHNYVGTEHLLLGLIREPECVASQVLVNLRLSLAEVRKEILKHLGKDETTDQPIICFSHSQTEPIVPKPSAIEPMPRRWTRQEYYRMGDMGFFHEQHVELIDGEIMVIPRQSATHWTTMDCIAKLLPHFLEHDFWVRMRAPLNLGSASEPEPDVSVVIGKPQNYNDHPTTAVLIVEVAENSLSYDRNHKASLYARAGIADYWIVNLVDKQLEVRRDPRPDPSQDFGHGYGSLDILKPPAIVQPLALPQVSLAVADLLA